jgi:hypothetical protein
VNFEDAMHPRIAARFQPLASPHVGGIVNGLRIEGWKAFNHCQETSVSVSPKLPVLLPYLIFQRGKRRE